MSRIKRAAALCGLPESRMVVYLSHLLLGRKNCIADHMLSGCNTQLLVLCAYDWVGGLGEDCRV